ncbi:MAG: hypothetical protein KDC87_14100 [Planctomycetes bacterium]|nr:hypothetical protein [Planctomycetota bacterium]MCB9868297.1 hypothetical protein [Planctomycetota bacterium]
MSDIKIRESFSPLTTKQVVVDFRPAVTAKEVFAAMERIFELAGCPNCGFNGIDIRFGARFNLRDVLASENILDARVVDAGRYAGY